MRFTVETKTTLSGLTVGESVRFDVRKTPQGYIITHIAGVH